MKKILNKKIIFVILPILMLLIVTLTVIGITNAAGNTASLQTNQTFTEDADGYYIWVRAVDHAGNKRALVRGSESLDRHKRTKCARNTRWKHSLCIKYNNKRKNSSRR